MFGHLLLGDRKFSKWTLNTTWLPMNVQIPCMLSLRLVSKSEMSQTPQLMGFLESSRRYYLYLNFLGSPTNQINNCPHRQLFHRILFHFLILFHVFEARKMKQLAVGTVCVNSTTPVYKSEKPLLWRARN